MKMSKIAAIVAAAALLVIGAAFTSMAATYDWQLENGEWVCYDKDGYQYYNTWAQSASGEWYYLGDEGAMVTNEKVLYKESGKYVYLGADGSIQKDAWVKIDNDDDDNTYDWYYFGSNGKMYTDKKTTIGDKIYCFGNDGKMLTGWVENTAAVGSPSSYAASSYENGEFYFAGKEDGSAAIGWKKIDIKDNEDDDPKERWFYFLSSGKKFFADDPSTDIYKTKKINGVYYAFDQNGVMQSEWVADASSSISGYFSDPEVGARVSKGWFQAYAPEVVDPEEEEASLNWYYAGAGGQLARNEIKKINGKYYCFNGNGVMQSGLVWVKFATANNTSLVDAVESATDGETADTFETSIKNGNGEDYFLYYFSGDAVNDGSMKFGTQKVTVDDEEFTLYFKSSSTNTRGQAQTQTTTKGIIKNGVKTVASADARYILMKATVDASGNVTPTEGGKTYFAYQLNNTTDVAGYVAINTAGRVLTNLNSKDGDGYSIKLVNGKLTVKD